MSSFRRRAIVVSRARSTERNSTGGRVSARDRRGGVVGIGEHPQPGDRVADLGAAEERRRARQVERDAALLHRGRHRTDLAREGSIDDHADRWGATRPRRSGARSRGLPPAPGRARCAQRQKRTPAPVSSARPGCSRRSPIAATTARAASPPRCRPAGSARARPHRHRGGARGTRTRRGRPGPRVAWSSSSAPTRLALSAPSRPGSPAGAGSRPRARRRARGGSARRPRGGRRGGRRAGASAPAQTSPRVEAAGGGAGCGRGAA